MPIVLIVTFVAWLSVEATLALRDVGGPGDQDLVGTDPRR